MRFTKLAGCAGLVFVAVVVAINIPMGMSDKPDGAASIAEIAQYYTGNEFVALVAGLSAPFVWVALPLFAVGLLQATRRIDGAYNPWALLGLGGVIMQNALFSGVIATTVIMGARAGTLVDNPQYTQALWDIEITMFTLNKVSLTLALAAFALAVLTSGTAPRWLGYLGLVGSVLLFTDALTAWWVLGGLETYGGLPGFLLWLVFIATYGVRLIKGTDPVPAPVSARA